jgi:thiosulfate dehydrogenase [quinone] large subunit
MNTKMNYTPWQLYAMTELRVIIGWHFLYEGLAKLMKPGWSAAGFLLQSKWLLAPVFKWIAGNPTLLSIVNQLNIWGLIAIGLGLMVGCLTRFASLAGIGLILLYYSCNPPFIGLYYSLPSEGNYLFVNKNVVEMAALLVLFKFQTSHILGFDRFIALWRKK